VCQADAAASTRAGEADRATEQRLCRAAVPRERHAEAHGGMPQFSVAQDFCTPPMFSSRVTMWERMSNVMTAGPGPDEPRGQHRSPQRPRNRPAVWRALPWCVPPPGSAGGAPRTRPRRVCTGLALSAYARSLTRATERVIVRQDRRSRTLNGDKEANDMRSPRVCADAVVSSQRRSQRMVRQCMAIHSAGFVCGMRSQSDVPGPRTLHKRRAAIT